MKILITLILIACGFISQAQKLILRSDSIEFLGTVSIKVDSTLTLIALNFSPTIIDTVNFDFSCYVRSIMSKNTFDGYVKGFKVAPSFRGKIIQVRVILNHEKTDYTFEEFRKLIYN